MEAADGGTGDEAGAELRQDTRRGSTETHLKNDSNFNALSAVPVNSWRSSEAEEERNFPSAFDANCLVASPLLSQDAFQQNGRLPASAACLVDNSTPFKPRHSDASVQGILRGSDGRESLLEHFASLANLEVALQRQLRRVEDLIHQQRRQLRALLYRQRLHLQLQALRGSASQGGGGGFSGAAATADGDAEVADAEGGAPEGGGNKTTAFRRTLLQNARGQTLPSNSDALRLWTGLRTLQLIRKGASGRPVVECLMQGRTDAPSCEGGAAAAGLLQLPRRRGTRRAAANASTASLKEAGLRREEGVEAEEEEEEEEEEEKEGGARVSFPSLQLTTPAAAPQSPASSQRDLRDASSEREAEEFDRRFLKAFLGQLRRELVALPLSEQVVDEIFRAATLLPAQTPSSQSGAAPSQAQQRTPAGAVAGIGEKASDQEPAVIHPSRLLQGIRSVLAAVGSASTRSEEDCASEGIASSFAGNSMADVLRRVAEAVAASAPEGGVALSPAVCLLRFVNAAPLPKRISQCLDSRGGRRSPQTGGSEGEDVLLRHAVSVVEKKLRSLEASRFDVDFQQGESALSLQEPEKPASSTAVDFLALAASCPVPLPPFLLMQVYVHLRRQRQQPVRQEWTPEEDARLLEAVAAVGATPRGGSQWMRVATLVPGRTNNQCRSRFQYLKVVSSGGGRVWGDFLRGRVYPSGEWRTALLFRAAQQSKRHGRFSPFEDARLQFLLIVGGRTVDAVVERLEKLRSNFYSDEMALNWLLKWDSLKRKETLESHSEQWHLRLALRDHLLAICCTVRQTLGVEVWVPLQWHGEENSVCGSLAAPWPLVERREAGAFSSGTISVEDAVRQETQWPARDVLKALMREASCFRALRSCNRRADLGVLMDLSILSLHFECLIQKESALVDLTEETSLLGDSGALAGVCSSVMRVLKSCLGVEEEVFEKMFATAKRCFAHRIEVEGRPPLRELAWSASSSTFTAFPPALPPSLERLLAPFSSQGQSGAAASPPEEVASFLSFCRLETSAPSMRLLPGKGPALCGDAVSTKPFADDSPPCRRRGRPSKPRPLPAQLLEAAHHQGAVALALVRAPPLFAGSRQEGGGESANAAFLPRSPSPSPLTWTAAEESAKKPTPRSAELDKEAAPRRSKRRRRRTRRGDFQDGEEDSPGSVDEEDEFETAAKTAASRGRRQAARAS